ncbi:hypothetical protein ABK040_013694 [Willaertia magna]
MDELQQPNSDQINTGKEENKENQEEINVKENDLNDNDGADAYWVDQPGQFDPHSPSKFLVEENESVKKENNVQVDAIETVVYYYNQFKKDYYTDDDEEEEEEQEKEEEEQENYKKHRLNKTVFKSDKKQKL